MTSDQQPPEMDLDSAHLRPARRPEPRAGEPVPDRGAGRVAWEGPRKRGRAAAFVATLWAFVRSPVASYAALSPGGDVRRAVTFALLCGGIFGVVSEIVDTTTVALMRSGGVAELSGVLQLDIAGRPLEWLPISALSAAGCLLALVVVGPLFLLLYSLLVVLWSTLVHGLLGLFGALGSSGAGYGGTLRVVCYSQVAMAAAIVPWIGDPVAGIWSFCLQVLGLARLHGCRRAQAALAVGLPALALIATLVLVVLRDEAVR